MSTEMNSNKTKDMVKEIIWTLLLYILAIIYWLALLFIISFVLNSAIVISLKQIIVLSIIISTIMMLFRTVKKIMK